MPWMALSNSHSLHAQKILCTEKHLYPCILGRSTHLVVNENLTKEDGSKEVDASLHISLVESLLYLTATKARYYVCY